MTRAFSHLLDRFSETLAARKGLLPLLGILLILVNFILRLIVPASWFAHTDLFLHMGAIVAILGILLATAL
jgi:nitrate reductase gamma subunit